MEPRVWYNYFRHLGPIPAKLFYFTSPPKPQIYHLPTNTQLTGKALDQVRHKLGTMNVSRQLRRRFDASYSKPKLIGEGGQAKVYKCTRRSDGRVVACKVAHTKHIEKEIRMLIHIMPEDDRLIAPKCGMVDRNHGGKSILILEWCDAGDLFALVTQRYRHGAPEAFCWHVFRHAAQGLEVCHEHGVIYRDMKPPNLLLSWPSGDRSRCYPNVKLADFGIAGHRGDRDFNSIYEGGTPRFTAPEHPLADEKCDVWALGATIHFMMHNRPPSRAGCIPARPNACGVHVNLDRYSQELHDLVADCCARRKDRISCGDLVAKLDRIATTRIRAGFKPLRPVR